MAGSYIENEEANTVISIDPGLTGAIAVFRENQDAEVHDMPVLKSGTKNQSFIDVHGVFDLIPPGGAVFIERQQAMPKQGVSSTFKTGYGYGQLIGMLDVMHTRYTIVSPAEWSKLIKRPAKAGKDWNIAEARRRFPHLASVLLKSKDGRADALLIGVAMMGLHSEPEVEPTPETDTEENDYGW